MQWLDKLLGKKTISLGVVGVSFLPHGMAVAVANYIENHSLKLVLCEFVATDKTEEQSAVLKKFVHSHKLKDYDYHLVLDVDQYRRINVEAPPVPETEIALALRWKIAELVDFPIDNAVLDYYSVPVVTDSSAMLEVIISPENIIRPLAQQCTEHGLQLQVIDVLETTLRNLAVFLPQNDTGVALLYLQPTFAVILIQKAGLIYAARRISIGYDKLNLDSKSTTERLANIAQDNLALEIQRSLDYVDSYYGIYGIAQLAVIPWGDSTQMLIDKLNSNYGIAAYSLDLITLFDAAIKVDYAAQSVCAPVLGAVLRNFIPAHENTAS